MTEEWVRDITQTLTSKLEAEIRKYPEQYFWFHRRWRDLDRQDKEAKSVS
jgi:Kdo2-lipid IVA lauroyltransferase/acyltransferase